VSFFLKFAIIGGSSVLTPLFIEGLIDRSNVLSVEEVALFARSKERLEVVGRLCQRLLDRAKASTRIVTTTDREEAIKNSDFVILTVGLVVSERDTSMKRYPSSMVCLLLQTK